MVLAPFVALGVFISGLILARRHRPLAMRLQPLVNGIATTPIARDRPPTHLARHALVVVALLALAITGGPLLAAPAIALVVLRGRVAAIRQQRRHVAAVAAMYPDFVDLLVLTIRAGCTPVQAFHVLVASVEQPLRSVVIDVDRRVADGARFADALEMLPLGLGAIAQPLADGLALADRHGTPLAPMLDRLSAEARSQRRRNAEAAARQLPIRLSFPLVGCTLPSFVLLTIVPLMAGTLSSLPGLRP